MDADRRGFSAGYSKQRVHLKDEASDQCNSFLISVHACESAVLFSYLGSLGGGASPRCPIIFCGLCRTKSKKSDGSASHPHQSRTTHQRFIGLGIFKEELTY